MMLKNKVAIVTGAGRGIGQGIALHLAEEGAKVALIGRSEKTLAETREKIEAAGGVATIHLASVSDEAAVEAALDRVLLAHGKIDILVNNAGIVHEADFLDITYQSWLEVIGTDLNGTFLMSQRVARRIQHTGGGAIVNIASIDAHGYDGPQAAYSAAKAAVVCLSKNNAKDFGHLNIRVNSVSPGWTHTPMIEEFVSAEALEYMKNRFDRVPMKRLVKIKEVAEAVGFLASDRASGINGIDLPVDCGTLATLYVYESLPKA
jgi:meso-butanediol dehydrogenase / (S,S)-butanediol dehydrogenase / diacetyl reductase